MKKMKFCKIIIAGFLTIMAVTATQAELYFWTDENGVKHFSNAPDASASAAEGTEAGSLDEIQYNPSEDRFRRYEDAAHQQEKAAEHSEIRKEKKIKPVSRKSATKVASGSGKFREISRGIYEVKGYRIDLSGNQRDDQLYVEGRISYGPPCSLLNLSISLKNRDGRTRHVSTEVEDAGGSGSRTIRAQTKIYRKTDSIQETWDISDIRASCRD